MQGVRSAARPARAPVSPLQSRNCLDGVTIKNVKGGARGLSAPRMRRPHDFAGPPRTPATPRRPQRPRPHPPHTPTPLQSRAAIVAVHSFHRPLDGPALFEPR